MTERAKCSICGEPMPEGEEMLKIHGYSGPCPKPPLPRAAMKPSPTKFIAQIDERELAIRICEAAIGIKRPPGKTLEEALADMPADWGPAFSRAARAAMEYWQECLQKMKQPS